MKIKEIILSLIIGSTLLVGCGTKVADTKLKTESISKAKTESITKAKAKLVSDTKSKTDSIAKAKAKLVSDTKSKADSIAKAKSKAATVTAPAKVDTTTSASKKKYVANNLLILPYCFHYIDTIKTDTIFKMVSVLFFISS